jgi:heme-degrading monooxygenase HmoA
MTASNGCVKPFLISFSRADHRFGLCPSYREGSGDLPHDQGGDVHIQIINFHLKGIGETEFRAHCDEVAPAFAEVPGLLSKVWLANRATNTYGGVYTWAAREHMEDFAKSDLFKAVATDPHLADITSIEFDVLEDPTSVTRGLAAVHA